jgi:hypothetical protein
MGINNKNIINCGLCNKPFHVRVSGHKINGKWIKTRFCSPLCAYKFRKKSNEFKCEQCGKIFLVNLSRRPRFCSRKCLYDSMKTRVKVVCLICGKTFEAKKYLLGKNKGKLCSFECKNEFISRLMKGENHPNWQGGLNNDYSENWTPRFKTKIRKRDNYTCQYCKKVQFGLDVHHIDKNKQNCTPENLITLCRSCHRNVHCGKIKTLDIQVGKL